MHGPMNVKSPNNTSKWQMGFNSAFKGLILTLNPTEYTTLRPVLSVKRSHSEHTIYAYNYIKSFTINLRVKKSTGFHVSVNYCLQFLHKT